MKGFDWENRMGVGGMYLSGTRYELGGRYNWIGTSRWTFVFHKIKPISQKQLHAREVKAHCVFASTRISRLKVGWILYLYIIEGSFL
jgi:hypothetical protein